MNNTKNSIKNMVRLSFKEELWNAITHGSMALIALILIPVTAIYSFIKGGWILGLSVSVFTICIFLMFLVSTLYHSMHFDSTQKYIFRILDHIFIFFAIAGSYTPIAINLIGGWAAIIILIIQWGCVIFGIFYKAVAKKEYPKLTLSVYLIMGWVAIIFMPIIIRNSSFMFIFLIALGGVLYSVGAYFYTRKKPYAHVVWHVFINLASISHYIAIVFFM